MDFKPDSILNQKFRLVELIGIGGFSQVFKAFDLEAGDAMVVRIFLREAHDLVRQEYQRLRGLRHRNIIRYLYFGVEDGYPYLLMPFFPDGSVLNRVGRLNEQELWRLTRDISSALEYLHGQQPPILHQDIRLSNIFVDDDGNFVLSDISFSNELTSRLQNTETGSSNAESMANVAYRAPEIFQSLDQNYNPAVMLSDVWSLGACLYELATGDLPFGEQGGLLQLMELKSNDRQLEDLLDPLPPYFSDEFNSLVFSSLALQPWHRLNVLNLLAIASAKLSPMSYGRPIGSPPPDSDKSSVQPPTKSPLQQKGRQSYEARETEGRVVQGESEFDFIWESAKARAEPNTRDTGHGIGPPPPPQPIKNLQNQGGDDSLVKCSVYAPPVVKASERVMVQVWLHEKKQQKLVARMAQYFFPGSDVRQSKYLELPLKSGDLVLVELMSKQIAIKDCVQKIRWRGEAEAADFWVDIPTNISAGLLDFTARLRVEDVPVGDFKFAIGLSQEASKPDVLRGRPRVFKKAFFFSYASEDRPEVLKRAQILQSMNIEFFHDLLSLRPGELWERALYTEIDTSDVFYLFWSNHSKNSEWVAKEITHALGCKCGNEDALPTIIPIPIEGPPVPAPPDNLRHLHFNDNLLYIMQSDIVARRTKDKG